MLKKSFQMARLFGTEKVRIFSYWRVQDPDKAYPHIIPRLKKAAALAEQNKILLVLENEPSCNVGTGKELGRMLRDINSPWLLGNWDPANGVEFDVGAGGARAGRDQRAGRIALRGFPAVHSGSLPRCSTVLRSPRRQDRHPAS